MNRRGFLKLCGTIAGSLCLPVTPGTVKAITASCAVLSNGRVYSIRESARLALGKWVREKIDDDTIAALSGFQEAA